MPLLSVSAHDIDAAGLALEADLPPAWLKEELADADLTAPAPGHVSVRLSRSGGDDIVVRGRVKADLTTPCARCMEPAQVPIDTELSLLLRPASHDGAASGPKPRAGKAGAKDGGEPNGRKGKGKESEEEEYEFTSEEADLDTYDGETVVLDPFVREAILLEAPNFPLCSEACPGIRPAAVEAPEETGPHLDPRLAPLQALRDKLSSQAGTNTPASSKKKKKE
jgi:uncharacterized protein